MFASRIERPGRAILRSACLAMLFVFLPLSLAADEKGSTFRAALESIQADRLGEYVTYLADDYFEGREAGSRGGREVGDFLAKQVQEIGLKPAGTDGYFQPFGNGLRNVIGLIPGRDPVLKDQIVLIEAHYDHVGYGRSSNSYGPIGYIHNGADDNASGTTGILCVARAFRLLGEAPKRTVVFAFWDGEEMGLLGSKHWISHPTLPLERVALALNVDMIGRLRDNHVIVYGTRTGFNLRRLVSLENDDLALGLDFTWELKPNGDHWPFYQHNVPVLLMHTGEHEDYHRPSDKARLINRPGMERVTRLIFKTLYDLAETPQITRFREAAKQEPRKAPEAAQASPHLPERLGALWQAREGATGVWLTWIYQDSPAEKAGLRVGDRIKRLDGHEIRTADDMAGALRNAPSPATILFERSDPSAAQSVSCGLEGNPMRLGIVWQVDDAEPGTPVLTYVMPGSPADRAGLKPGDRVYRIAGRDFRTDSQFAELAVKLPSPLELLVERDGQLRVVVIHVSTSGKRAA